MRATWPGRYGDPNPNRRAVMIWFLGLGALGGAVAWRQQQRRRQELRERRRRDQLRREQQNRRRAKEEE